MAFAGIGWLFLARHLPGLPLTFICAPAFTLFLAACGLFETACPPGHFRALKDFGNITYSTYLLHSPIQMTLLFVGGLGAFNGQLFLTHGFAIIYIVTVIILA